MAITFSPHARDFPRRSTQDYHDHDTWNIHLARDVTTTPDGVPVAAPLPVSVRVLTAFFVILGSLIVGIITWRIVVWRRRKLYSQKNRLSSFLPSEKIRPTVDSTPLEQKDVLVILPIEPPRSVQPSSGKWVPQMPPPPAAKDGMSIVNVKGPVMLEGAISSPPTYTAVNSSPSRFSAPRPPALNLPTVTVIHNDTNHLALPPVATPVPSPRRMSSFRRNTPGDGVNLKLKPSIKSVKGEKLPRKMLVEHTFIPSLADELTIEIGETLLLLEEYEDEWCLVERVGSSSGERGVVPRFCLKERPRAGHRRGMSSVSPSARNGTTRA